eukprot:scaffold2863_cov361-Pavlova_lutheri.AAC.1
MIPQSTARLTGAHGLLLSNEATFLTSDCARTGPRTRSTSPPTSTPEVTKLARRRERRPRDGRHTDSNQMERWTLIGIGIEKSRAGMEEEMGKALPIGTHLAIQSTYEVHV